MLTLLTIAGGVALILFGVRFLRKGLDRLFGPKLGTWMQRLAHTRLRAFFTGIGIALVAPSSTTMSVLAVTTVQTGHLTSRQTLAVMLGAHVGLTAMVLLISLQVDQYAPILALIGVSLFQFTQSDRSRGIGQVVVSLAFIFLGIGIIKQATAGLPENEDLMQIMAVVEQYPVIVALVGASLATILQSSTATIALVIALSATGSATLATGIAIVAGANVGLAVTTLMVGWGQIESRRLAFATLAGKIFMAVVVLAILPHATAVIAHLPGNMGNQIAYANTLFNTVLALACLPLVSPIMATIERLVPQPPQSEQAKFGPRHIHSTNFDSTALALGLSLKEILHVGELVRHMLSDLWRALKTNDVALAKAVSERDDRVDLLDWEIKRFLTRVIQVELDARDSAEQMRQLRYLAELETIGDIIDKNLSELVVKKARMGVDFSPEGWQELDDFYNKVSQNLLIADTAFTTRDKELAQRLLDHKEALGDLERKLRDRHFSRLRAGREQSHETSAIHLDLLTHLKRINSHVTHVAYATLTEQ